MSTLPQAPAHRRAGAFTVLDWLGAVWAGFAVLGLLAFPLAAGSYRAMYADFGDAAPPTLTHIVTQPWVPPLLALVPLALLINAFRRNVGVGARRASVVAAFVLASSLIAGCLWAVYLPIFGLADAVGAE